MRRRNPFFWLYPRAAEQSSGQPPEFLRQHVKLSGKGPLQVIPIALDCVLAPTFSDHVRVAISHR
ncbi:hypothetical protein BRAO375_1270013 [Bradyrhizobium sp. ORS 375]|nr:hypothetical protein BRAO375_1270013 [Bradyrhizobium sp. ORS 375]